MVVAIVALIAALGGTAIAGGVINKKKAKNIANNVVTQRAPGLSVASAKNADNATNAGNATTANSAKNVFFARVAYSTANPTVTSGSPGVVGNGESFTGAAIIHFPRDMTNCAITATGFTGGADVSVRQSSNSSGNDVVLVPFDDAGSEGRHDFNLVAVCP
jgi:hypothetical protein